MRAFQYLTVYLRQKKSESDKCFLGSESSRYFIRVSHSIFPVRSECENAKSRLPVPYVDLALWSLLCLAFVAS